MAAGEAGFALSPLEPQADRPSQKSKDAHAGGPEDIPYNDGHASFDQIVNVLFCSLNMKLLGHAYWIIYPSYVGMRFSRSR